MRTRFSAFTGASAAAAAAIYLTAGALAAQTPAQTPAPKPAATKPALRGGAPAPSSGQATPTRLAGVKRTADGHPDLSGTYDVATMTPVERPAGVKSLTLSKEEAAALEQYEAA